MSPRSGLSAQLHLIDTAELHEIIHISRSHIIRQSRENTAESKPLHLHLIAIYIQCILRGIPLKHRVYLHQGRLATDITDQSIRCGFQFARPQIATIFELHFETARNTQSADSRRIDGKHNSLLQNRCIPVQPLHHIKHAMFFPLPVVPGFQHHEKRCRIGRTSTLQRRKTHDIQGIFHFGVRLYNSIQIVANLAGPFHRCGIGQLHRYDKITLIFLWNKRSRPLGKSIESSQSQHDKSRQRHQRFTQHRANNFHISVQRRSISLIKPLVQEKRRFAGRLEKQCAQSRSKRQRIEPAEYSSDSDRQSELFIQFSCDTTDKSCRNKHGQ